MWFAVGVLRWTEWDGCVVGWAVPALVQTAIDARNQIAVWFDMIRDPEATALEKQYPGWEVEGSDARMFGVGHIPDRARIRGPPTSMMF